MLFSASLLAFAFSSLLVSESWELLAFDQVSAGKIEFAEEQIRISVNNSASPMVQSFGSIRSVSGIEVAGTIRGDLNIPGKAVWKPGYDDAFLRFGVIESGSTKLSTLQKLTAPRWLKKVNSLFAPLGGISKIHTYQLLNHAESVGKARANPANSLFLEEIVSTPGRDGKFRIVVEFPETLDVVGLWILADGDDTASEFEVIITNIEIFSST